MADAAPRRSTADHLLEAADRLAAEGRHAMAEAARRAARQPTVSVGWPGASPRRWPAWATTARPLPDDADER